MKDTHFDIWLKKLDRNGGLSEADHSALRALPVQIVTLKAGQDIVRQGDRPTRSCLIIDGFAAAAKTTGEGNRQIASFYVAGDMPDLQSLHIEVMDITFVTMTTSRVAFIRHEPLWQLCLSRPKLAAALWRTTLVDAAIYREWVANVGQRQGHQSLAHLFCELIFRLQAVGLADRDCYAIPLSQIDIGDALGVSVVHVNRSLKRLREAGLVDFSKKRLRVLNWDGLVETGDFDPTYLHLR